MAYILRCDVSLYDELACLCFVGVAPIVFSGGIGGACLWLVVYPMDCVKSRIQVMSMTSRQSGFFKTFMHIFRTEGKRKMCFSMLHIIMYNITQLFQSVLNALPETSNWLCFCLLIFRCKGSIFWFDSHNDPDVSGQWCFVFRLWSQP